MPDYLATILVTILKGNDTCTDFLIRLGNKPRVMKMVLKYTLLLMSRELIFAKFFYLSSLILVYRLLNPNENFTKLVHLGPK